MTYLIKAHPEDFIVEEVLLHQPEGTGEVFWIQFEKRNLTTMDVIAHLLGKTPLERKDIGIAGLKDKIGITRQWLTIYRSKLEICGGESAFLSLLSEKVKILNTQRGKNVLRIGGNAGNRFKIRVRNINAALTSKTQGEIQQQLLNNVAKIKKIGFPNAFGHQRFGKKMKNFREAREIIHTHTSEHSTSHTLHHRFSLQAYPSGRFNEYVMTRREKGRLVLEGDIMVDRYQAAYCCEPRVQGGEKAPTAETAFPTGPMLGYDLLLAPEGSKARIRENQLLELASFGEKEKESCKKLHLMGYRRPLWVYVPDIEVNIEGDDAVCTFSLPTGSYATVVLGFILAGIDDKSLKENKLDIPRINMSRL